MPDRCIPPHGFTLKTEGYGEVIIDISIPDDISSLERRTERKHDFVQYSGSPIVDVLDVETEDHLDPVAWYDEWIKPLKKG